MTLKTIDLYNLDVGEHMPFGADRHRVGPFEIRLVDNYEELVRDHLPQAMTRDAPGREGDWVVTAQAIVDDEEPRSRMIHRIVPDDAGVYDLCWLLTFLSGARVITDPKALPRRLPRPATGSVSGGSTVFSLAATAWDHRDALVEAGLVRALLHYNEALNPGVYEVAATLCYAALDVLMTQHKVKKVFPAGVREEAQRLTVASLAECPGLTPDLRQEAEEALEGFWKSGGTTAKTKLRLLLLHLAVIEQPLSAETLERIALVMRIRDALMHTAAVPTLKGFDPEVGRRVAWTVIFHVVPDVLKLGLGRVLGLPPWSQRFSQMLLREFFDRGTYNDYDHSYDIGPFK